MVSSLIQDETGEEGVIIIVPEDGTKKVRMGTRVSADKIRQSEHEGGAQMKDAHERNKGIARLEVNDQAHNSSLMLATSLCVLPLFCSLIHPHTLH